MNGLTENVVNDAAEWVLSLAKSGTEIVADQWPSFVQEVLMFHRVLYVCGTAMGAMLLCGGIALILQGIRLSNRSHYYNDGGVICVVSGGISSFVGLTWFSITLCCALKVWFAPRLFLIEWAGYVLN